MTDLMDQSSIIKKTHTSDSDEKPVSSDIQESLYGTDVAIVVAGSVDAGKCFGEGTKIMKYDKSIINVEDVKIDDVLMGDDLTPRKVIETHSGIGQLYKIISSDKKEYIVNGEHILCLKHVPYFDYLHYDIHIMTMTYYIFENGKPQCIYKNYEVQNIGIPNAYKILETEMNKIMNFNDETIEISVNNYMKLNHIGKSLLKWYRVDPDKAESKSLSKHSHYDIEISPFEINKYYGFGLDGNKRFLLGDFSVVHNSSLVGVLYSNKLDNGNGSARETVARHQHEIKSGKTSDISTRIIKSDNGKIITLVDLCGHEKYLKTTAFGITGYFPDYAIVVVAANRGIIKMTKEHLGILIYMNVPIIIVITRSDIAPEYIYEKTVKDIRNICKIYNKKAEIINSYKDAALPEEVFNKKKSDDVTKIINLASKMQNTCDYVPVITVSNKTGYYIDILKTFVSELKPRMLWDSSSLNGTVYYIDSVFNPPGIGIVLSGIVKGKPINVGDILFLGPYGKEFIQIRVRSIHNNVRTLVPQLKDHCRGCIAVSPIGKIMLSRQIIQKGMIVVNSKELTNNICYRFKAEIEILHHSTTIHANYTPIIHVGTVRQAARILDITSIVCKKSINIKKEDGEINIESKTEAKTETDNKKDINLKTGDKAIVSFKFKFKPEFIEKGYTFFFKEGTTRGKGEIIETLQVALDDDATPDPLKARRMRIRKQILSN